MQPQADRRRHDGRVCRCIGVKLKEDVLIAQPFSPALFCQGPAVGPTVLLRVLRGELLAEQAEAEFDRMEEAKKATGVETDLLKMRWPCMACRLAGRNDFIKPLQDFNVRKPSEFVWRLLPQGAWSRCIPCSKERRGRLGSGAGGNANNDTNIQRQLAAGRAMLECKCCSSSKTRSEFWEDDWRHRAVGILCKACQPLKPSERKAAIKAKVDEKEFVCDNCGQSKRRPEFWPRDLKNKHQGLLCKAYRPVPPEQRRRRLQKEPNA